jgi:fructose-1-phosphate kinase PfkB-like protein
VAANGESVTEVIAPRIDAVCPIGSGDALNAAFIWAMTQEDDFLNAARWGVAAGSASARLPGLSFANPEQTKEIFPSVEIRIAKE